MPMLEQTVKMSLCRTLWDLLDDGIALLDHQGSVLELNRAARSLLGDPPLPQAGDFVQWFTPRAPVKGLLDGQAPQPAGASTAISRAVLTGEEIVITIPNTAHRTGIRVAMLRPLLKAADNFDRTIFFATRDPVTRFLNREAFEEKLEQVERVDGAAGLICIDVNRLALVNEAQGYSAGDAVLCAVAERLRTALAGCELARIAAGRFAALVHPPHAEQQIAEMLDALRQAMQTPIVIAGAKRLFSVSVGVALGPLDGQVGASLMTAAELAIRRAHAEGVAERWFVPQMLAEHRGRLEMESDLREAMAAGRLQLHYQPKVRWPKGTVEGFEALLRWPHPSKGYIAPDTFIPVAEACGLIISLGQWVMREACRQLAEWRDHGLEPLPVAVNVSPHQLLGQPLDELLAPLAEFQIPQEWIEIEITETALMDNLGSAGSVVDDLRRVGMKISIDDFGTGHSSLGNLRRLPITTFKIDRSFVEDIETSREARDIAATIVAMARALSLDVVAEGVENERQAELLAEIGAQVMQGYLFSRPVPADVAVRSLAMRWVG